MPQAKSAHSLYHSIGINTHIGYFDTIYADFNGLVFPLLQELGIKHVRDGVGGNIREQQQRLFNELGIRFSVIINRRYGNQGAIQFRDDIKALGTNIVRFAEGVNEPDLATNYYTPYPQRVFDDQREMFNVLNNDPATVNIPVTSPSLAFPVDHYGTGFHDICDVGNIHPYSGDDIPENMQNRWSLSLNTTFAGKPIIATEIGDPEEPHWHPPNGVTERIQAVEMLRQYLHNHKLGWLCSYFYQLVDNDERFGLVQSDRVKRVAFEVLERFIALVADTAAPTTLGSVNFTVTNQPNDLDYHLVQKSDGTFLLFYWRLVQHYHKPTFEDPEGAYDIPYTPESITFNFDKSYNIQVVDVMANTSSTPASGVSVVVPAHDYPVAIVLSGGTVVEPPPPPPVQLKEMRINCGSDTSYTDPSGLVWDADNKYRTGGTTTSNTNTIERTHKQGIYQSSVWGSGDGNIYYRIPRADFGNAKFVDVHVRFMEGAFMASGQRKFNIDINGSRVATDLDPYAITGGRYRAIERVYHVTLADTATMLEVRLHRGAIDNPDIHGLEIRPR